VVTLAIQPQGVVLEKAVTENEVHRKLKSKCPGFEAVDLAAMKT
jgi:hypothetical protein